MRSLRKILGLVVILVCGSLLVLSNAYAANLYVPRDYPTIHAAINAAVTGDTVWVDSGTYTEKHQLVVNFLRENMLDYFHSKVEKWND